MTKTIDTLYVLTKGHNVEAVFDSMPTLKELEEETDGEVESLVDTGNDSTFFFDNGYDTYTINKVN